MLKKFGTIGAVALLLLSGTQSVLAAPIPSNRDKAEERAAAVPLEVRKLLGDKRALSELNAGELRRRARLAKSFAKLDGLSASLQERLSQIALEAQAEFESRQQSQAEAPEPAPEQPVAEPEPEQSVSEGEPRRPERKPRAEEPNVETPADPAPEPETPVVTAEAEERAQRFLRSSGSVEGMNDRELRVRLDEVRQLMSDANISPRTQLALRKLLQRERIILRDRVAAVRQQREAAADERRRRVQEGAGETVVQPEITIDTPPERVVRDRRNSEDLSEDELRRRLEVTVEVERDEDAATRERLRERMQRDRRILRQRMVEERRRRAEELERNARTDDIEIEVNVRPERRVRDVFEAEANDEQLEDVLVSAPRRKVRGRFSLDDIEEREDLREAMPRIEIDTIRFGFNESFVREEEIENLDRVASIIERVLRKSPREKFLIEGHTDAVGGGAYNRALSRQRAEAVKRALTEFYVIPSRNLLTVGLGERYLRIPTQEAEAENRRVSVSRATPLLGELD